jgi:methylthioribose-1-phosphate isomerase
MKVDGVPYRTVWPSQTGRTVQIIDQTRLPHEFAIARLDDCQDAVRAIREMQVRGAPLIGAAAAYGVALAMSRDPSYAGLCDAYGLLLKTRPTAVNLRWALDRMLSVLSPLPSARREAAAWEEASAIAEEDVSLNRSIGENGLPLIRGLWEKERRTINILTHCNAGWLATVDWGTALAPVYLSFDAGIPLHVWVSETRPRNQGASLTAWELGQHRVAHTVIVDSAAGHLMQRGLVDVVIVGTDRTTARGDVCNKIGTYLEALAARDSGVPFYVAAPGPSIDWHIEDGMRDIPIEQRDPSEVSLVRGRTAAGSVAPVTITPAGSRAANYAFDVTPGRLVTALITERGVCPASRDGLLRCYPEHAR